MFLGCHVWKLGLCSELCVVPFTLKDSKPERGLISFSFQKENFGGSIEGELEECQPGEGISVQKQFIIQVIKYASQNLGTKSKNLCACACVCVCVCEETKNVIGRKRIHAWRTDYTCVVKKRESGMILIFCLGGWMYDWTLHNADG